MVIFDTMDKWHNNNEWDTTQFENHNFDVYIYNFQQLNLNLLNRNQSRLPSNADLR